MTSREIEKIFRDEAGRALATLIRLVGDFDLAEDALQDAFAVALERWPAADPPSNPRAWLVNVGRNKAIDRIRRSIAFRGKQGELLHELLLNASAGVVAEICRRFSDKRSAHGLTRGARKFFQESSREPCIKPV